MISKGRNKKNPGDAWIQKKPSKWKKPIQIVLIIFAIIFCGTVGGCLFATWSGMPDVSQTMTPDTSSQIFDRKGRLITTVHAEQDRLPVDISVVPKNLQNAFIAAEDIRFYEHGGIDPRGIMRAAVSNILHGNATGQGGSTITQQLARNAFLTQEQTIRRKVLEVILALEIESQYTKDEILQMYMNQIYFGQGCYGVQTASNVYFGKNVQDLNLAQCAMLAGLPNSPNYYSPFRSLEAAKYRQAIVLDQMAKYGYITEAEAAAAKEADLELAKPNAADTNRPASYFISYIIQLLADKYGAETVYKEGLRVYTTLDLDMQKAAEAALRSDLPEGVKDGKGITQPQGALLSMEAKTGKILAMVGGRGDDHFNRAVQMTRQPGSAFKPFTYVTALANGRSSATSLPNTAKEFANGWTPQNYDRTQSGSVSLHDALVHSLNIPTVNLANDVGIGKIIETAKACGISTLVTEGEYSDMNLSASIGGLTYGVSVWDMTKAFGVFANNGKVVEPFAILKVEDRNGTVLEDHETPEPGRQVLELEAVEELNSILQDAVSYGTGGGANIGRPMAGKTGTTDNEHDAWFVGYTPDVVTAVWIGDDSGSDAGYTGGTIPASIWRDYMSEAVADMPVTSFSMSDSTRQRIAAAAAEAVKKAAEEKKKEEEKKRKEAVDKVKKEAREAGAKLLDRISGNIKGESKATPKASAQGKAS